MARHRKPQFQGWSRFPTNYAQDIVSIDLFTVPAATFRVLFAFRIPYDAKRNNILCNVAKSHTQDWTNQQIVKAFP